MIAFPAIIGSRSTVAPGNGPPGEEAIQALNPTRRDRILAVTGWKTLSPGSLNLNVYEECVHKLLLCTPRLIEKGSDLTYPHPFTQVPTIRIGYLYYSGKIEKAKKATPILIRRACNPVKWALEAFAEDKLRISLDLSDGDQVICEIDE